jgi:hypothetical protein
MRPPHRPPTPRCRPAKDGEKAEGIASDANGFKTALFGVLYTLAKEKINDSAGVALFSILIDFVLILFLFITPHYQWAMNGDEW